MMRERGFDSISTVTIDVGQPQDDIDLAAERAKTLGTNHYVVDAKEEFAREFCGPAIGFNADYFGYPLSTSIARPLIAQKAAEMAKKLGGIDAFVHGCTGKGNDQFRIEFGLRRFMPEVQIIAPIREGNLTRSWEIEYAEKVGAPIGISKEKIWSIDENLWGRSIEGGRLEEVNYSPPEEIFQWTKSLNSSRDKPSEVEIHFVKGIPVKVIDNGATIAGNPLKIILACNEIAGDCGVGRIDIMEDRMIGLKVRENYECPGAVLLIAAHKALEALVTTHAERAFKAQVDAAWADLAYKGLWWEPLMEGLTAFSNSVQRRVTGSVRLKLYKSSLQVMGRNSEHALYSETAASFDDSEVLQQSSMAGMVAVHGLESLLYSRLESYK